MLFILKDKNYEQYKIIQDKKESSDINYKRPERNDKVDSRKLLLFRYDVT